MRTHRLLILPFSLFFLASPTLGAHPPFDSDSARIHPRAYVTPSTKLASYDYVIAGGGLAGLTLAARLSEDGNTTVLVLEAGDSGDSVAAQINSPGGTYYNSLLGTSYDYAYKTVPQTNAGNRVLTWPRGKVLGGSSDVNGMYIVRPSAVQVSAWSKLISADTWSWDNLLSAMKKSETFTPPSSSVESTAGMQYQTSSRGSQGPLQATYPAYMVPITTNWLPTLNSAGITTSPDAYNGINTGGFFATSAINPSNWTRSSAKAAYYIPASARPNLNVMVNAAVTRITWASQGANNGTVTATGVEFSCNGQVGTVKAKREVILSGGSVGSPQVLMLSGVGPRDVLESVGVDVVVELPGVGQHVQDHLVSSVTWSTTAQTQGTIYNSGSDFSKSAQFLSFINSGTAYLNGSYLFSSSSSFSTFQQSITTTLDSSASTLVPSQYAPVVQGYKAIYSAQMESVLPTEGLVELLLSLNAPGQVTIQAALQIPFSQGRLYINSTSVFDQPVIDPQYYSHPADVTVMRQGLKAARTLGQTAPLSSILGNEISPGSSVSTDEEWEAWLRSNSATEYHPSSTCAMMPLEMGGVVDEGLKVYGISNVRVVDASVFPLAMSTHLMAPTYGLAEQAAIIIRAAQNPPGSTATNGSSVASSATPSATTKTTTKTSGAESLRGEVCAVWLAMSLVAVVGVF